MFKVTVSLAYLFFKDRTSKMLFKITVKIFDVFVLPIHSLIVLYNVLIYLALIRPVFCVGAIVNQIEIKVVCVCVSVFVYFRPP